MFRLVGMISIVVAMMIGYARVENEAMERTYTASMRVVHTDRKRQRNHFTFTQRAGMVGVGFYTTSLLNTEVVHLWYCGIRL